MTHPTLISHEQFFPATTKQEQTNAIQEANTFIKESSAINPNFFYHISYRPDGILVEGRELK